VKLTGIAGVARLAPKDPTALKPSLDFFCRCVAAGLLELCATAKTTLPERPGHPPCKNGWSHCPIRQERGGFQVWRDVLVDRVHFRIDRLLQYALLGSRLMTTSRHHQRWGGWRVGWGVYRWGLGGGRVGVMWVGEGRMPALAGGLSSSVYMYINIYIYIL